ncbi:hypothetical protein RJ639_008509 [Escallonia herrerae]|uniref:GDSL esterase/lipase n=1 Tax=Escallonia herrerae TaxID=1293975 RepID=A0AA89ATP8_9ASTE|nr:hypothetical protein RJ639_008509 [Escallonia herrerae]
MAMSDRQLWCFTVVVVVALSISQSFDNMLVAGSPQAPAMFVLGDSLVDDGNNNFLNSIAKSNYYPYGCDFSGGPTGGWLGLPSPPPFEDPATNGARILGGVNYASAAAGILDNTGLHYGDRFSLSQQVVNFETTLSQLRRMMSPGNLTQYLSKSIVVMVFGSNDYINNYLMPSIYDSSINYTPPQFANLLLNHYAQQIVALYSVGLRKFLLAGVGPLGCIPNQLATGQAPPGRCVDRVNQMLGRFNEGLKSLVNMLNDGSHPGAMFVYGNTYGIFGDILNNAARYGETILFNVHFLIDSAIYVSGTPCGFNVTQLWSCLVWYAGFSTVDRGCCGIGRNQGQITCLPYATPCINRSQYVFWDAFHPTQAANAILAQRAYMGPTSDCHPMNVQQLALIS